MLITRCFESTESYDRAFQTGSVVGDMTFKGTASSFGTSSNFFVHFASNAISIPTRVELLLWLSESLAYYDIVHPIENYTGKDFSDGKISFVIDV